MNRSIAWTGLALATALLVSTAPARADFHTYQFSEIFSNADGTVQFIELHEMAGLDFQNLFSGHTVTSNANNFTFPSNLPSTNTANTSVLLGTAAYAALPGAVAPDYTIPANFFSTSGDTLNYGEGTDLFAFTGAQLPLDGTSSLLRDLSTPTNSPTNFSGQSGSVVVPEPGTIALLAFGGVGLLAGRRRWRAIRRA